MEKYIILILALIILIQYFRIKNTNTKLKYCEDFIKSHKNKTSCKQYKNVISVLYYGNFIKLYFDKIKKRDALLKRLVNDIQSYNISYIIKPVEEKKIILNKLKYTSEAIRKIRKLKYS